MKAGDILNNLVALPFVVAGAVVVTVMEMDITCACARCMLSNMGCRGSIGSSDNCPRQIYGYDYNPELTYKLSRADGGNAKAS